MAFVVDGGEWEFNGWEGGKIVSAVEALIARVWTARDRGERVWIGDELQTRSVLGTASLWSLFAPDSPVVLSSELGQELAAWLSSAPRYLDEEQWPAGIEHIAIRVDEGQFHDNPDQAWAHHHVRAGRAVACMSIRRCGVHTTTSVLGSVSVYWVADEQTHRKFWRDAIEVEGGGSALLERQAAHAFPDLYFPPGVWEGMNDFAGGYLAVRTELIRYLAVLDDHGAWAFKFPPPALSPGEESGPDPSALPSNQIVERRFHGLNLEMAPENPDVRADNRCRRARELNIGGRVLYCEWHGKLQPHRNRIHVHPPVVESSHKLVVARFHEHLPLP